MITRLDSGVDPVQGQFQEQGLSFPEITKTTDIL